jgi:hypothetical protein
MQFDGYVCCDIKLGRLKQKKKNSQKCSEALALEYYIYRYQQQKCNLLIMTISCTTQQITSVIRGI